MGSPSFARMALPPGFRFHPTDVELIMYWLKRKVSGKKLHFEAIAEVNIYNFSPWDLPDMSCLGSKDLEWFFFCPREKKYASGTRVKRATENGYWKTTGKDRYIYYNDRVAGTVKTLVFHLGHPPKGERTDWVIHEYKIIDGALAAAGVQDSYVLCKVFKKNGLGPKNGAQYGAPFNEADWADEDVDALNVASSVAPAGPSHTASLPEKPSSPMAGSFDPGSTPAMSLIEEGPTINGKSHVVGLFDAGSISGQSLIKDVPNGKHSFISTGLFNPGNTSGLALIEEELAASAMPSNNEVLVDQSDDDIIRLLSSFTDDDTLFLSNQNGKNVNHKDNHNGKRKDTSAPCLDGYEIYNGLGDLNNCSQMNEVGLDFSGMQNFPLNDMVFPENMDFIELNDLQTPLNCTAEDIARELAELSGSYNHENMQYIGSADGFDGMGHYSWESQLPMLPDGSNQANSNYDMLQGVSDQFPQVSNMVYDLEFARGLPGNWENGGHHLNQDMERGSQNTKYIPKTSECIPFRSPSAAKHLALSFSSRGDSSIHIKAEVTCDVGVCTKEALSVMVGESSSCWWNVPLADFQAMWLWVACHLLYSSDFGSHLSYCYYLDGSLFISRSCYRHWCSGNSDIIFLLVCISAVMLKTISLHAPLNICKLILVFSAVVESLII